MTDGGSTVPTSAGPATRSSVVRVGVATVISALCGYAVLYLAARDLEPAGFSIFAVFWGAFGLLAGAANGLLQESTREVRQAQQNPAVVTTGPHTRPLLVAVLVGCVAALAVAGSAPLWSGHVFVESRLISVVLLSVGIAGFCLHATLSGALNLPNRIDDPLAYLPDDGSGASAVLAQAVAALTPHWPDAF